MKIKVLCIDDEEPFLEVMREYLGRDDGLETTYVTSVDAALEALDSGGFDVVVSDYQMPGADGVDLLRAVRSKWGDIPFILFTGRGREEIAMRALNEGADFYLQKSSHTTSMFVELKSMIVQSYRRWSSEKSRDEALERFQRYADTSRDFMYRMRIKPSPYIEYFSPCVKDLVGYEAEEFYRNPDLVFKCLHPDDLERYGKEIDNPQRPEKPVIFRWLHKDGRVVYAEDTWVPVTDSSGEIVAIDGMSRDVTDRVMAEEGLKQANKKLELIAGLIRHDTLNRLTSIVAGIDMIRSGGPSDAVGKLLGRMETDAKMIARQLEFSSDYQKTVTGHPDWIPLKEVVEKVVSSWDRRDILFDLRLDGLEVLSDYVLERVFSNLVEDSFNHGEHVTRIGIYYEGVDGGVEVVYEDDGVGIPSKEKELIFDRGFGKGTGYGLYLTREILGVSGVTIKEVGEYGRGAKFVIRFPRDLSRIGLTTVKTGETCNGMPADASADMTSPPSP
jgi:PAS domain S-box-containing protein